MEEMKWLGSGSFLCVLAANNILGFGLALISNCPDTRVF
jgi:hypothetical protein